MTDRLGTSVEVLWQSAARGVPRGAAKCFRSDFRAKVASLVSN